MSPADSVIAPHTALRSLSGHKAGINSLQLQHDEIVSASGNREIRIWSLRTGSCLQIIDDGHEQGIATLNYDGTWIVTGSSDRTVGVFEGATGKRMAILEGHEGLVNVCWLRFMRLSLLLYSVMRQGINQLSILNGPRKSSLVLTTRP